MKFLTSLVIYGFLLATVIEHVRCDGAAVVNVLGADQLAEDDVGAGMANDLAGATDVEDGEDEHANGEDDGEEHGIDDFDFDEELTDIENEIERGEAADAPYMGHMDHMRRGLDGLVLNALERLQKGFMGLANTFSNNNNNNNYRSMLRENNPILFDEDEETALWNELETLGFLDGNDGGNDEHDDDDSFAFDNDEHDDHFDLLDAINKDDSHDDDGDDTDNISDINDIDIGEIGDDFLMDINGDMEDVTDQGKIDMPNIKWAINLETPAGTT